MRVIHVLRKPISEGTVASNVLKHGVGGLNIDASRVKGGPSSGGSISGASALGQGSGWNAHANRTTQIDRSMSSGRWPANVILHRLGGSGCPVARLDEQSGVLKSGALPSTQYTKGGRDNSSMFAGDGVFVHQGYKADTGGASRFYKQVGGGKVSE